MQLTKTKRERDETVNDKKEERKRSQNDVSNDPETTAFDDVTR